MPALQRGSVTNFVLAKLISSRYIKLAFQTQSFGWWAWPSWLGHLVVAQEVVGSSPIAHPIHFSDLHSSFHLVLTGINLFYETV